MDKISFHHLQYALLSYMYYNIVSKLQGFTQ